VFSDYYDCSRVRIKGGAPLTEFHQPTFRPGGSTNATTDLPDRCRSTVDALGVCGKAPCDESLAEVPIMVRVTRFRWLASSRLLAIEGYLC